MTKKSSTPAIRFKGFTDPWEQRKLGEILIEHNTRTSDFENNPLYSLTIESGITPKTERYERSSLVTKTEDLFKVVKPKEFVTNPMNLRFGALGYNTNPFDISVSGYYDVFSIDNDKCSGFWNSYFKAPIAMKIFDNAATGSLIEKRRVKYSTLQQLDFYMPKMLEEKVLIGRYMDFLDNLITLHQRKYDKLTNVKKSMLEKMFPKNGSNVPEIRFKGFTEAWEQRKVSDLAEKTYGGGTPTTSNEAYWNGDIPWIQSSDVVDGKLLGVEPRKWITQDGLNNSAAQLIPGNSIAIITRVGVGKLAFMPYSYATSQDFLSLSKLNAEPLFTVYACYKKLQSELNAVQGTSIKGITKDELLAKNIMVPRYAEQQQIGTFFKQLDNLITLHQRELEKLKNLKKACLERCLFRRKSKWEKLFYITAVLIRLLCLNSALARANTITEKASI